jgi:long-subunit acyl-CoA synthetase (AMP-forming)
MLTPTMKVKRSRIEAATQDHLDGWYAAKQKVCWAQ